MPIPHTRLLQAVWGPDYGDQVEYLRVFVNQLRKKIEPDPSHPKLPADRAVGRLPFRFAAPIGLSGSASAWLPMVLPACEPELNPVESIRAHLKQHELPNVCPQDYWALSQATRRTLKRMRRRPRPITAF